jgi:hypothetical protein
MTRHDEGDEDIRLTRLLQVVRADADPALWTRVRARIESRPRVPALLALAMRPAALAASFALLLATAALALLLVGAGTISTVEEYASLGDALLAERDAQATAMPVSPQSPTGAARDSGSGS